MLPCSRRPNSHLLQQALRPLGLHPGSAEPTEMNSTANETAAAPAGAAGQARPSAFERLLFRRVPLWLVLLVALLGLAFAVAYGAFLLHILRGGQRLAWLHQPALLVADAPSLLTSLPERTRDPFLSPPGAPAARPGLERSGFVDDGFLLVPEYDPERRRVVVRLLRLADGAVLREYLPDLDRLQAEAERLETPATPVRGIPYWIGHPELLGDGSIVFKGNYLLARVDVCGALRWARHGFHHSVERGPDGGLWTAWLQPEPDRHGVGAGYRADAIVRVDLDGRITYSKSLDRLFAENGLAALIRGREYSDDPYHLNDVQPVHFDGPYWRRGDVFLSLGHQAMVLLYRPSTGRILWWRIGPWQGQHDVNVIDERRISVFDNRISFDAGAPRVVGNSRELVYDFSTGRTESPWEEAFRRHRIAASSNGRGLVLANGDVILEESNRGEVLRVNPEGAVRWRYVNANRDGERYRLFWSRYLDPAGYAGAVAAAQSPRCEAR